MMLFQKVKDEMLELNNEYKRMEVENNVRSKEIRESIKAKSKAMKEKRKNFHLIGK